MSLDQLLAWVPAGGVEAELARQLHPDRLPRHVAIIMDGNGRWAGQRHLPRVEGHRAGIDAVRDVVETSARLGLEVLTLYAFSVENWKRPATEVGTLMMLLKRYLRLELSTLLKNNIRFNVIGRAEELAPDIRRRAERGRGQDRQQHGDAVQHRAQLRRPHRDRRCGAARDRVGHRRRRRSTSRRSASLLYTKDQPDPDLLIRTSGEMRVSNFLLWQIAYAEIYVTDTSGRTSAAGTCSKRSSRIRSATAATGASRPLPWLRACSKSIPA